MSAAVAVQAVVTGLALGAVYGLVGLGFTLVYRLTRVLNFAHGDLVLAAVFVAVYATVGTSPVVAAPSVGRGLLQVGTALAAGVVLSVVLYAVAVRSAAGGGVARTAGWVAATIAAGLVLRDGLSLVFTGEAYAIADPLRLSELSDNGLVGLPGGGTLEVRLLGVLLIGLLAGVAVERFVVASRTGRAMRAVADDPQTATLMGIPAGRLVLLAFAISGLLAGLAGVLLAPGRPVSLGAGVVLGLKGSAAALIGRLGSLRGAIAGGLVLGVMESLARSWSALGPAYADVLPLTLLVVLLAVRPEGIGSRRAEAVE